MFVLEAKLWPNINIWVERYYSEACLCDIPNITGLDQPKE
jgi:hypothetical protein